MKNFQRGKFNNDLSKIMKDWIAKVISQSERFRCECLEFFAANLE